MKILLVLALLISACASSIKQPTTPPPAPANAVRVEFLPSVDNVWTWRADQIDQARAEMKALRRLGPPFVIATDGTAQYTVRQWYSDDHCTQGVARWFPGTTLIEVDASCAHGYDQLRAAIGHELGHAMGMHHVCLSAQNVAGECIRDGHYGPAMMNPDIAYGDPIDAEPGDPLGVATDVPTELDLAEYSRTHH